LSAASEGATPSAEWQFAHLLWKSACPGGCGWAKSEPAKKLSVTEKLCFRTISSSAY